MNVVLTPRNNVLLNESNKRRYFIWISIYFKVLCVGNLECSLNFVVHISAEFGFKDAWSKAPHNLVLADQHSFTFSRLITLFLFNWFNVICSWQPRTRIDYTLFKGRLRVEEISGQPGALIVCLTIYIYFDSVFLSKIFFIFNNIIFWYFYNIIFCSKKN